MNTFKQMNLPNKLTVLRILMVPIVVACYLYIPKDWLVLDETSGLSGRNLVVFVLFAIASLTDMLDGQIARKTISLLLLESFLIQLRIKCWLTPY